MFFFYILLKIAHCPNKMKIINKESATKQIMTSHTRCQMCMVVVLLNKAVCLREEMKNNKEVRKNRYTHLRHSFFLFSSQ